MYKKSYFQAIWVKLQTIFFLNLIWLFAFRSPSIGQSVITHPEYEKIKVDLLKGWNTWYNNSMLTHVYMPTGFALSLHWKQHAKNQESLLHEALMTHSENDLPQIIPREHAWDGSYTHLEIKWHYTFADVETATEGQNIVFRISQKKKPQFAVTVALEAGYVWNKSEQFIG